MLHQISLILKQLSLNTFFVTLENYANPIQKKIVKPTNVTFINDSLSEQKKYS
jgi:hypothetical protein